MKIVVALDSFKGTLSAAAACAVVAEALARRAPAAEIVQLPMADGGEGTIDALVASCSGHTIAVPRVTGPLPDMRVAATYGWLPEARVAVVEMARASGLPLLEPERRNPMLTTTRGTGELLRAARAKRPGKILLTLGGSATVDGGVGAARALGWEFLDHAGRPVPPGGVGLAAIVRMVPPSGMTLPRVEALCDVTNPLCGPNGAAAVYGPQKGATPAMVRALEEGLANLATRCREALGKEVRDLPGAGAAGGFGAGAVAFLGAELVPGIAAVAATCGLERGLRGADWVVTGEGRFDPQSLQGKVISGVRDRARRSGTAVAVLAGQIALPRAVWREAGIAIALATSQNVPFAHVKRQPEAYLRSAAEQLARLILN